MYTMDAFLLVKLNIMMYIYIDKNTFLVARLWQIPFVGVRPYML